MPAEQRLSQRLAERKLLKQAVRAAGIVRRLQRRKALPLLRLECDVVEDAGWTSGRVLGYVEGGVGAWLEVIIDKQPPPKISRRT